MFADSAGRAAEKPGWNPTTARSVTPLRASSCHHTTEAEPDGGNPVPVDAWLVDEHLVAVERELAGGGRIVEELAETSLCFRDGVQAAASEVVEGERHVAEHGEAFGPDADVVVLACALVHQQHSRPVAVGPAVSSTARKPTISMPCTS